MTRHELTWFALRFPRDLSDKAVIAALSALSGVSHRTRLIFDLSATSAGIIHRLAISDAATDGVTSSLHAAIPSLRLDETEAPTPPRHKRWLWQLTAPTAAVRSDNLNSISAALLASCWPLHGHETIHLRWTVRASHRPHLPLTPNDRSQGHTQALRTKLALPGVSAYGELFTISGNRQRQAQLRERLASVLRSLATSHGRLMADPYWYGQLLHLLGLRGRYLSAPELAAVIGWPIDGPDLPGLELGASKRLLPAQSLAESGRILGVSNAAGSSRPVALTPTAATRGLYVLGPTGTGKTSLIKNLVRDDLQAGRGLAVIETNGDLINDLLDLIPSERTRDVILLDPLDPGYAVGFNPFASSSDPSLIADHLGELFQRLWSAYWGPRTGQLAHMGLLTLARRRGSTLLDLPRLFLDPAFRAQVLRGLNDPVGLGPDWQWFENLPEREQASVIAPLLNKVRQFSARPAIRAIMGQPKPALSMSTLMAQQQILLAYLPKGLLGAETVQLLGCLLLTALWQAATERARLPLQARRPFGLYVDEVQDFAAAPIPWDEMFAQGRKYGLALTVAHQNLDQLDRSLREVILANARSKAVFSLSASDARGMERLFAPALSSADLQALDAHTIAAIVALDSGGSARPVTLTTPPPPEPVGSADSVRQVSRERYARSRADIEAALRAQVAARSHSKTPIGRKRRPS